MKERWFSTTFARLLLGVLALVLVVMGPMAYFVLDYYRDSLTRHYQQETSVMAAGLASAGFNAAAARDFASLQEIVEEVERNTPADVAFVVDRTGKIWAHSDPAQVGGRFDPEAHRDEYFDRDVPIGPGDRVLGYAHAGIARARLAAELDGAQWTLALVFLFALIVALGLAVLLSSSTARPMRRLTQQARTIADGRLDAPLGDIRGPAEIRAMARTFEEMRESLHSHMDRLERSYRELDRRMRDITILYRVSEAMNAGDYNEALLETILGEAVDGLHGQAGLIWLAADEESAAGRVVATRGFDPRQANESWRKRLETAAQETVREGKVTIGQTTLPGEKMAHLAGVPLRQRAGLAGAVVVARTGDVPAESDVGLLEALASHAARCVERAKLYAASISDGLTGLYVSRHFRLRLKEELRTAARYKRPLSLLMLDIDHFKKVNDTWGHPAGDEVLRRVARCILDTVREDIDIAARYGGEEFAVVLPETDREGARVLAERLRVLIAEQQVDVGAKSPLQVTISLGVACSPDDAVRPEALIERADEALYKAKNTGRNRVVTAG